MPPRRFRRQCLGAYGSIEGSSSTQQEDLPHDEADVEASGGSRRNGGVGGRRPLRRDRLRSDQADREADFGHPCELRHALRPGRANGDGRRHGDLYLRCRADLQLQGCDRVRSPESDGPLHRPGIELEHDERQVGNQRSAVRQHQLRSVHPSRPERQHRSAGRLPPQRERPPCSRHNCAAGLPVVDCCPAVHDHGDRPATRRSSR